MRLIRFGPVGEEKPGLVLEGDTRIDASGFGEDWNEQFFGSDGLARLRDWVAREAVTAPKLPDDVRLGPCVCRPSKIICIGLNFVDHVRETGAEMPSEPVLFFKSTTALCGPEDDVWIPRGGGKLDWEVELAVVIGKTARHVEPEQALDYVAGLCLHNDYSERGFQIERQGQWCKGKGCDRFAPLGPWLATLDEIGDFRELAMWCEVNGEPKQDSNTANMIFDVPSLVSYISQFMTLVPGDVISTGTPAGVGLGFDPPVYLQEGDVVRLGIDRLGEATQRVARAGDAR